MANDVTKSEPAEKRITFARKNDLSKILKRLDPQIDEAIDFLSTVMNDADQEMKIRVDAAKYIIDKRVEVSESISRDHLSRTLGEAKLLMAEKAAMIAASPKAIQNSEDEEEKTEVRYCPDVIIDVSKTTHL